MKRILLIFITLFLCLISNAQTYRVIRTVGNVILVTGSKSKSIKANQELHASDIINVGAYSMLELLDENAMKKICIKTPGQNSIQKMCTQKNTSFISISKQYIQFIKTKMDNPTQVVSDPATITMQGKNATDTIADKEHSLHNNSLANSLESNGINLLFMQEYDEFRRECFEQYVEFVRDSWKSYEGKKAIEISPIKKLPPTIYNFETAKSNDTIKPKSLPVESIISVDNNIDTPMPLSRIPESMLDGCYTVDFSFYGTPATIRFCNLQEFKVINTQSSSVADAMSKLGDERLNNTIRDCLGLRYDLQLNDWAYLLMLQKFAETIYGRKTNEAILLTAYLYIQSGYKVRLGADNFRLYMLVASKHTIYRKSYYELDGDNYYSFEELPMNLKICNISFPNEKSLSLILQKGPKLAIDETEERIVSSTKYPDINISFTNNKNIIDFFNSYPTSKLGDNVVSRWAMYANTPIQECIKEQIYPPLKKSLDGCDDVTSVEKLLNLVQTGFEYEYDDVIWGCDRAFFAEETLFYPFCDCEDRSILFTRLVRDILGLKCILVYYPGHLAAAVALSKDIVGDYIEYEGDKFFITDPTYIGAPIGTTMKNMDNNKATVILLDN